MKVLLSQFSRKWIPIFIMLLSYSMGSYSDTQRDFQTWLNLTMTGYIDKQSNTLNRVKYWLEGQERIGDDSTRSSQTLLRTGLGYELKSNLSLWVGYAWIYTGAPNTSHPYHEDRIWEQLLWVK